MFEEYTYEALLSKVLADAPDNIDTRQGSIFYDSVSGILLKIAKLYTDLDLVLELVKINTATGEFLDEKASEHGISRNGAVAACYYVTFEGTTPDLGERFYTDGIYFTLRENDDGVIYLQCETAGTAGNNVYEGTAAIPVSNISGLTAATFGKLYSHGTDEETDDSLRARLEEKISGPAENGNKQHYKMWCESVTGVGTARITALWNGPNTVKGVLINSLGLPCTDAIVNDVQEYIDPATKGYTATVNGRTYVVGDGLGEGVANLGAHFTACAPEELTINVSLSAVPKSGYDISDIAKAAKEAIASYLAGLTLASTDDADVIVRYVSIGAILANLPSLLDYSGLTINGGENNITCTSDYVAVCGEVTVNAL